VIPRPQPEPQPSALAVIDAEAEGSTMNQAFICDAVRTPFGRYGGALSSIRTDDLGALPLIALMERNPGSTGRRWRTCCTAAPTRPARTTATSPRMSALLAGLPIEVPGATINRLCGSGMDAVGSAARGDQGGRGRADDRRRRREHEPRAVRDAEGGERVLAHQRGLRHDDRLALRQQADEGQVRRRFDARKPAENVAAAFNIPREAQDRMALASQQKAVAAQKSGFFDGEIAPVTIVQKKGEPIVVARDEHPRDTSLEALAKLKGVVRPEGSVTAGNASGVNDGACALLLASERAATRHGLTPRARVVGMATAGVPPRIMGIGPAPATRKVLELTRLNLAQMDVIELNEAFAAQGLAVLRDLGLADDDARVNPNGGAIALGHPLGCERCASRHDGGEPAAPERRPLRPVHDVHRRRQGIAIVVERV
jgi:acetyl-CoA C-acetyltransferase